MWWNSDAGKALRQLAGLRCVAQGIDGIIFLMSFDPVEMAWVKDQCVLHGGRGCIGANWVNDHGTFSDFVGGGGGKRS